MWYTRKCIEKEKVHILEVEHTYLILPPFMPSPFNNFTAIIYAIDSLVRL